MNPNSNEQMGNPNVRANVRSNMQNDAHFQHAYSLAENNHKLKSLVTSNKITKAQAIARHNALAEIARLQDTVENDDRLVKGPNEKNETLEQLGELKKLLEKEYNPNEWSHQIESHIASVKNGSPKYTLVLKTTMSYSALLEKIIGPGERSIILQPMIVEKKEGQVRDLKQQISKNTEVLQKDVNKNQQIRRFTAFLDAYEPIVTARHGMLTKNATIQTEQTILKSTRDALQKGDFDGAQTILGDFLKKTNKITISGIFSSDEALADALRKIGATETAGKIYTWSAYETMNNSNTLNDKQKTLLDNIKRNINNADSHKQEAKAQYYEVLKILPNGNTDRVWMEKNENQSIEEIRKGIVLQATIGDFIKENGSENLPQGLKSLDDMKGYKGLLNFSDENAKMTKEVAIFLASMVVTGGASAMLGGLAAGGRAGVLAARWKKAADLAKATNTTTKANKVAAAANFVGKNVVTGTTFTLAHASIKEVFRDEGEFSGFDNFWKDAAMNAVMFGAFSAMETKITQKIAARFLKNGVKPDAVVAKLATGATLTAGDVAVMQALYLAETGTISDWDRAIFEALAFRVGIHGIPALMKKFPNLSKKFPEAIDKKTNTTEKSVKKEIKRVEEEIQGLNYYKNVLNKNTLKGNIILNGDTYIYNKQAKNWHKKNSPDDVKTRDNMIALLDENIKNQEKVLKDLKEKNTEKNETSPKNENNKTDNPNKVTPENGENGKEAPEIASKKQEIKDLEDLKKIALREGENPSNRIEFGKRVWEFDTKTGNWKWSITQKGKKSEIFKTPEEMGIILDSAINYKKKGINNLQKKSHKTDAVDPVTSKTKTKANTEFKFSESPKNSNREVIEQMNIEKIQFDDTKFSSEGIHTTKPSFGDVIKLSDGSTFQYHYPNKELPKNLPNKEFFDDEILYNELFPLTWIAKGKNQKIPEMTHKELIDMMKQKPYLKAQFAKFPGWNEKPLTLLQIEEFNPELGTKIKVGDHVYTYSKIASSSGNKTLEWRRYEKSKLIQMTHSGLIDKVKNGDLTVKMQNFYNLSDNTAIRQAQFSKNTAISLTQSERDSALKKLEKPTIEDTITINGERWEWNHFDRKWGKKGDSDMKIDGKNSVAIEKTSEELKKMLEKAKIVDSNSAIPERIPTPVAEAAVKKDPSTIMEFFSQNKEKIMGVGGVAFVTGILSAIYRYGNGWDIEVDVPAPLPFSEEEITDAVASGDIEKIAEMCLTCADNALSDLDYERSSRAGEDIILTEVRRQKISARWMKTPEFKYAKTQWESLKNWENKENIQEEILLAVNNAMTNPTPENVQHMQKCLAMDSEDRYDAQDGIWGPITTNQLLKYIQKCQADISTTSDEWNNPNTGDISENLNTNTSDSQNSSSGESSETDTNNADNNEWLENYFTVLPDDLQDQESSDGGPA